MPLPFPQNPAAPDLDAIRREKIRLLTGGKISMDTIQQLDRLKQAESIAKGNVTRAGNLEAAGVDVNALLEPSAPNPDPRNFLEKFTDFLDSATGLNTVRTDVVSPLLEKIGAVREGRLTELGDRVQGEDIVSALRGKEPGEELDWKDTLGGLGINIFGDPASYATLGAGAGVKLFKGGALAGQLTKAATKKEFLPFVKSLVESGGAAKAVETSELMLRGIPKDVAIRKVAEDMARNKFIQMIESNTMPASMLDKGGLKFGGKTVISRDMLGQAGDFIKSAPVIGNVVDTFKPAWQRMDDLFRPPESSSLFQDNTPLAMIMNMERGTIKNQRIKAIDNATRWSANFTEDADQQFLHHAYESFRQIDTTGPGRAGRRMVAFPKTTDRVAMDKFFQQNEGSMNRIMKELMGTTDEAGNKMYAKSYNLKETRDALKEMALDYNRLHQDRLAAGISTEAFLPFFAAHIADFPNVRAAGGKVPAAMGPFRFAGEGQPRIMDTLQEFKDVAELMGIKVNVKFNAAQAYAAYHSATWTAIAHKNLIKDMGELGLEEIKAAGKVSKSARRALRMQKLADTGIQRLQPGLDTRTDIVVNDFKDAVLNTPDRIAGRTQPGLFARVAKEQNEGIVRSVVGGVEFEGPRNVLRALETELARDMRPDELRWLGGRFRKVNNFYKRMLTSPFPSFHGRNVVGDTYLIAMDDMMSVSSPKNFVRTAAILMGKNGQVGNTGVTFQMMRDAMDAYGLKSFNIGRQDLVKTMSEQLNTALSKHANVWEKYVSTLEKGGAHAENFIKMASMAQKVSNGIPLNEAVEGVFKAKLKYEALSNFDRSVKQIIPFWTWQKKNPMLQARLLTTRPGKQLAVLKTLTGLSESVPLMGKEIGELTGIDALQDLRPMTTEERTNLPEFIKEDLVIPYWKTAEGFGLFVNLDLPITEFNQIVGVTNGMTYDSLIRIAQKNAARVTPAIKSITELVSNFDFFFGGPLKGETIDEDTGMRKTPFERQKDLPGFFRNVPGVQSRMTQRGEVLEIDGPTRKMLELAGLSRFPSEISRGNRLVKSIQSGNPTDVAGKLIDILFGMRTREEDTDENRRRRIMERIFGRTNVLSRSMKEAKQ